MTTIETWDALDLPISVAAVLAEHRTRLEDYCDTYDLEDLARFVILEPGEAIETLVPPEYVIEHIGFKEAVQIYSDDVVSRRIFNPERVRKLASAQPSDESKIDPSPQHI